MKYLLLALSTLAFSYSFSQSRQPQLEAGISVGLFAEKLSDDNLVPSNKHGDIMLGNVSSFVAQVATPLKDERFIVKAGLGFSTRHYSFRKNDVFNFFGIFSGLSSRDTFNLQRVKFINHYIQFPFSFSYAVKKPSDQFRLSIGLNVRPDILTASKAKVVFDSEFINPSSYDYKNAEDTYTQNASKFVLTVEPYIETYFFIAKDWNGLIQFRPFSLFSSVLDKNLTTSTTEILGFTFGAAYKF